MRRAVLLVVALLTSLLATTACVGVPDTGPVVSADDQVRTQPEADVERRAQRPQEGQSAQEVVTAFLQAMTAYPVRTDVARQFLATDARAGWDPLQKVITYEGRGSTTGSSEVKVDLLGAHWIDSRGNWRGEREGGDIRLRFPIVQEGDAFRIASAPNALIVPDDWFQDRYAPASIYYLDPTARILVPEPVFVPTDQVAAALVDRLLDEPSPALKDVVRSFVPPGLKMSLSVPVSDEGAATITLEGDPGPLTPEAAKLMVYQFAWTLRQDERVTTFSITIGDQPVTMEGGTTQFSVELGSEYAPYDVQASSLLFRLRDGLLESGDSLTSAPVDGPLGRTQYGVERVSVSLTAGLAASVSGGGTALSLSSVNDPTHPVTQVLSDATRLLTPAWDFADRLWVVDQTADGARVSVIDTTRNESRPIPVDVPGISGKRIRTFMVSRDGTRLVAVVQGKQADTLRISRIRYDALGRHPGATRSRNLQWSAEDVQRIRDIGWRSVTSIGVLYQLTRDAAQVASVPVDGSSSQTNRVGLLDRGLALVASPAPNETLYIRTPDGLADPTGAEGGTAPLPPDVSSIGYAG
jgi:hypothetical protein